MDILSSLNKGGSGLDLRSLTTSLVAAEFQPRINSVEKNITKTEASISGLGQVRAQMDKLGVAAMAIASTSIVEAKSSTSAAAIEIKDPRGIREGVSDVYVDALATRQVIEFTGFSSKSQALGAGTISVEIGGWVDIDTDSFTADPDIPAQTVTILPGETLEDIAKKLSALDGVTARVLDKGDGTYSLGLVSEVGYGSAIRMGITEDPLNPGLAALDMTTGAAEHQVQAAADAILEVDGFLVSRPTNTVDDLVPGATLTLQEVGYTKLSVSRNPDTAADNLEFLIETVNETLSTLKALTSRGADGNERGALAGDLASENAIASIHALMAQPIGGFGDGAVTLGEMGVIIRRDGSYSFDRDTFDKAFAKNPKNFEAAFTDRLETNSLSVEVSGTASTKTAFGDYAFSRPGGTGSATIAGERAFEIPLGGGKSEYVTFAGPMAGVRLTVEDGIEDVTIHHARSFMSLLKDSIDNLLSGSGQLAKRESQLETNLRELQDDVTALDAKAVTIEDRYMEKFMAMELAITQLNSTGEYLTNLIDSWNNSNN